MSTERQWFAIGDPQAPFERFLGILRGRGLLDHADKLRDGIGLVSMGDHFDFDFEKHGKTLDEARRAGTSILTWLAEHSPDQVVILMGNHDAARVMELAFESDESFARARQLAESSPSDFFRAFPRIPTPDIALRDYSSFAVHQRERVQRLLLQRRMRLAAVGSRDGHELLLTHAGVTTRQVDQLEVPPEPRSLAAALERRLGEAIDRVRPRWEHDELAALDLLPLHTAGTSRQEGGGLLYHRVSAKDASRQRDAVPRRFHPRELPRGLAQVCGHTGHHKCKEELEEEWLAEDARALHRGGLRTLIVDTDGVRYTARVESPSGGAATMYMIDIEMSRPEVTNLPLFELDSVASC